jgi:hypothetical protein
VNGIGWLSDSNEAQSQVRQMTEAQLALGIEKTVTESKLKTLEERLARERALLETQKAVARFATESEICARIAQFKDDALRLKMEWFTQITKRIGIAGCPTDDANVLQAVDAFGKDWRARKWKKRS